MTRYTFFVLTVCASVATAYAAIASDSKDMAAAGRNVTIVEKNQAFPLVGPFVVESCVTDDCAVTSG